MTKARKESALHLALLVLTQFISLAVVILNATALYLLRNSQPSGLIKFYSSPADYMLLILGSASFLASTIFLFLHLHLYFRIIDDQPFSPPKSLSAIEVIFAVISIALWTVASAVILTHSQEPIAPCRFTSSLYNLNHNDICELFDTTLMLAFSAVGGWAFVLLATLFTLIRSPVPPTTIFTIEAPPQRFSQPMLVTSPNEAYFQPDQLHSRPYYLGHHHHHHHRNLVSPNKPMEGSSSKPYYQKQEPDTIIYTSYYQPQYVAISSSSNNNSSTSSSSYYSTIPHVDTQRSIQSLSTLDSFITGFQPLNIDLPVIQVGALSHIDVSFLQAKQERQ